MCSFLLKLCLYSTKSSFHMEFVIVRDPVLSSGGSGGEHERERRGPLRVLSGSPERRIMGLGCGVGLSLCGFDHTIASSAKQHKNSTGQNCPSLLLFHYARHLSPHRSPFPFLISFLCTISFSSFFPPILFISLPITHLLFFFSSSLSSPTK